MSDWEKRPVSRTLTRSMRASNRVTQKVIDEHKLTYEDLAEVWATPDELHVVLSHKKDPVWQYWTRDGDIWIFTSVHKTLDEAQQAALIGSVPEVEPGTYVVAQFKKGRIIRVRCTSSDGPDVLRSIFTKLDYAVRVEEVA